MDAWGAAFAWRACRTGIGPCGATLLASLEGARPTREALLAPALSWYRTLSRSKGTLASAGASRAAAGTGAFVACNLPDDSSTRRGLDLAGRHQQVGSGPRDAGLADAGVGHPST